MPNAQEVLEWMEWKDREKKLNANMTKEEYIRTCSTEELADAIADVYLLGYTNGYNETDIAPKKKWVEWLKEKHEE